MTDAWKDKTFTHEDIRASFDAGFSMGFQAGVQAQLEAAKAGEQE